MLHARVHLHAVPLALLLICETASAQVVSARLEGVVRDASGAVVPGAGISAVNSRTRIHAETSTTSEGIFIFPSLQPGLYTLSMEAAGFRKTVVSDLELNVGATVVQNVKLEIGDIEERIVVRAGEERVQIADAQIAHAVTLRDIDVLPQLSRTPMTLAIFSTGVQVDPNNNESRVNGNRRGATNTRLDGVDVNDTATPMLMMTSMAHNTDSIEEFRIVTSGGKAEYGRNAGAQIELITRSGTNSWHGNAFEYHRNAVLNASSFFANKQGLERPKYIQNTFGGSLGGPIRRDRTFIFGNFQGHRQVEEDVRNRTVLTPEARKGLFRWQVPYSSEIRTFGIVDSDPRHIGIDPKVGEILRLLPNPNNYEIGDKLNTAGFRFNAPVRSNGNSDQITVKADHTLRNGHRFFFRWTWFRAWYIDSSNRNEATFPGQPSGIQRGHNWGYSIGSDWAITTHLVNELRVGYKFYTWQFYRPARLPGPMLLSNYWTDPLNPAFSNSREPPVRQITDNFTIVRSKHIFKGGIEGRFTREWRSSDTGIWPNVSLASNSGNYVPSTIGPFGAPTISSTDRQNFEKLYNDLLGRVTQVTQTFYSDLKNFQPAGTPRVRTHRFREFSGFFQDDWKIHPRLVLNLGLRCEFYGVPFETNGIQGIVDKAALINSAARIADVTIRPGSQWYNNDLNNFAPRIGLAWDLSGNGKTVLRVNWGIFYDRLIGATTNSVDANTPGFSTPVYAYPNRSSTDDLRVNDGIPPLQPPAVPELTPRNTRSANLFLFSPDFRTPYVQHYGLTIQREIFRNTVVEAGFVGTHGIKLFMDLNFNQTRIYEDFLAAFRQLKALRMLTPNSNTLVRIFGSPSQAINAMGTNLDLGAAGSAADSMDRLSYARYAPASISDFYLRNFPQFNQVVVGTNDGRSYYNSFQLSVRRQAGALKFAANYTFSKSLDNISVDGIGFTSPIDNFNVRLSRARGDWDIPHAFNSTFAYALPVGKDRRFGGDAPRWLDPLIGGWDIGLLALWQSGQVITCLSGVATGPTTGSSFANYTGDRNIGRVMRKADGVYWLTAEEISRFSLPSAGEIGTGGRNAFRGPRYFYVDMSMVKKFKIGDRHAISFRAEAYNLFNNVNFGAPSADLSQPTFGQISSTVGNPRVLRMALRYDF